MLNDLLPILLMLAIYGIPLAAVAVFIWCIVTLVRAKRNKAAVSREKFVLAIVGLVLSGVVVGFLVYILVLLALVVAGVISFM